MKQLQTIYDNIILLSEIVLTDIEIENEAIMDHLWSRHSCVRKPRKRHQNWQWGNYRPFLVTSFLCQKVPTQTWKLKRRQVQTIYDNVILVSESLQTDIKIENEAVTDHLWQSHSCVRKPPNWNQNLKPCNYRPFMIMSFFLSDSFQTDIEIENEAITDHL